VSVWMKGMAAGSAWLIRHQQTHSSERCECLHCWQQDLGPSPTPKQLQPCKWESKLLAAWFFLEEEAELSSY